MKVCCLAAALLMLLCGCSPDAREPESVALVRVLGVDGASPVTLTAVCGGVDQADPARGSCTGETFGLARERLPWSGEEELALTSVSWVILGRDAELEAVLWAVLEDRELGASVALFRADGEAAALLDRCGDPAAALELYRSQGIRGPTAARAMGLLLTEGSVRLPLLSVKDGKVLVSGEERWNGAG